MKKITHEEFIKRIAETNRQIEVVGQYVSATTKVRCKCSTCDFEWESIPATLYSGNGCLKCSGQYQRTREEFIEDLSKVNPTVEIIGTQYKNTHTAVDCRCRICGREWSAQPYHLLNGHACSVCSRKNAGLSRRKTHEQFVEEMARINAELLIIGSYVDGKTKIRCRCNVCKHEWDAMPSNLKQGEGCPTCGLKRRVDSQRKSHEQFVNEMRIANEEVVVLGAYVSSDSKIDCKCAKCGHEWSAKPGNLLKGSGCPWCAKNQTSFFERYILLLLQKALGAENVLPRDCSAIGRELDIYIPDMRVAIEPGSWFWHKRKVDSDKEKYELCKQRGIQLITIYDKFDDDREVLGFNDDFITYCVDFCEANKQQAINDCINKVFNRLNLTCSFSEREKNELFRKAKAATTRKTTTDVVKELAEVNPNIQILSDYHGCRDKLSCRCSTCGHEWKQTAHELIARKRGCPVCSGSKRPVINLDTGDVFDSITEAAKKFGVHKTNLSATCIGKNKTCGGYRWAYLDNLPDDFQFAQQDLAS